MRKRNIIIAAVVLIVIVVVIISSSGDKALNYTSVQISRGEVLQTVSATGAVEAKTKIDMKFVNSGRIEEINVKVGDEVKEGDVLAKLESAKLESQLAQAEASLAAARANLQELLNGATSEDIRVAETAVANAEIALASAKQSLEDANSSAENTIANAEASVSSAEVTLDNAKLSLENTKISNENNLDQLYDSVWDAIDSSLAVADDALGTNDTVLDNDDAADTLSVLNSQYLINAEVLKGDAENLYDETIAYRYSVNSAKTYENADAAIEKTENVLTAVKNALSETYKVLQSTITSSTLTQTELDALKSSISNDRAAVNTSISSMTSKRQAIATQKITNQTALDGAQSTVNSATSALNVANNSLASAHSSATTQINSAQNAVFLREGDLQQARDRLSQVKAGATSAQASASRAQVDQAAASVELIKNQIRDSYIIAPRDGVVTSVEGEVGEIASTTGVFLSIMISNGFEIKANISEVDISKIKVGDEVEITFDALGSDQIFKGEVSEIDPAETEISGVVYYKVMTIFTGDGEIIKPGMTANLDIMTASEEDVIRIPFQALNEENGRKFVKLVDKEGNIKEKDVVVGLRGDAYLEITDGVSEGDELVTFIEEE